MNKNQELYQFLAAVFIVSVFIAIYMAMQEPRTIYF